MSDAARAPAQPKAKPKLPTLGEPRSRELLVRFFHEWIAPRWRELVATLLITFALAAATGGYPLVIKFASDTLLTGDTQWLPHILAVIVAITLARSVLLYLHAVAMSRVVMRMSTDIQKSTFAHLLAADYTRFTREPPGHLMSRIINDTTYVDRACEATLSTAIRDTVSIAALVGTMFYLDWMMSIIILGVYPLAALPIAILSQRLRQVAKKTQLSLGDMTSLLTEKLSGIRLIKSFGLEEYAAKRVNASFDQILALRLKAVRNRARIDPMLEALGGLAVAGVIAFAYWRIVNGHASIGDFMGFVTALLMAAQPIRAIGNLSAKIQEGLAALERITELKDDRPQIIDKPGAKPLAVATGTIAFQEVGFTYDGASTEAAVRNLSLVAPGGATVALVGRSGAGKSTLINLVPRLFDVTAGRIEIDGQDIRDVTLASLRGAISIVSQEVTLFDDTIRANIALGRLGASEAEIVAAAKAAAAHEFILAQPEGYDTEIGDRGLRLSGGQRQRLALARAILKDAPILLLDEATSALDTESERLVQGALARFTKNRTTLVIAHRLSTVQNADLICVMDQGTIIEQGTHAELMARDGAYARLCRTQLLTDAPAP